MSFINWTIPSAATPGVVRHPTYGNYGGLGWTGGEYFGDAFNGPAPVSQLDALFQQHDQSFDLSNPGSSYEANKAVLDGIQDLINDPNSQWNDGTMSQWDLWWDQEYADQAYQEFRTQVQEYEEENNIPPEDRWVELPPPPPPEIPSLWIPWFEPPTNPEWEPEPTEDPFELPPTSPLVFDLDSDGIDIIELGSSTAYFDLDNNGFAEHTAWIGGDDGFLAIDANGNGRIDDQSELFGAQDVDAAVSVNGFTALASLDSNNDGEIDSQDAAFSDLVIWQDSNSNGLTDVGELQSLASHGIISINLAATFVDNWVGDNWISHESTFTTTSGSGTIADVWFANDTMHSLYNYGGDPISLDEAVVLLPNLKGYGVLADLHVAMQENLALRQSVSDLLDQAGTLPQNQFISAVEGILFEWAGVQDVVAGSRGVYIDAQHLGFMEAIYGRTWRDPFGDINDPLHQQGAALENYYTDILSSFTAKFLVQVPLKILQNDIVNSGVSLYDFDALSLPYIDLLAVTYDVSTDSLGGSVPDIVAGAVSQATDPSATREEQISRFINAITVISLFHVDLSTSPEALHASVISELETLGLSAHWTALADAVFLGGDVVIGDATDETLSGSDSSDALIGAEGDDTLSGHEGDDSYVWLRGDGNDTVVEQYLEGTADRLVLEAINPSDVTLVRDGNDVTIVISESALGTGDGGSVRLVEQLDDYSNRGIEQVVFADGTIWDADGIRVNLLADMQTSGDDTLTGFNTNDTFHYTRGDGNDTVIEEYLHGNADRLMLNGINASDVTLSRDGNHITLVVAESVLGAGDGGSVRLFDQLDDYYNQGLEEVEFGDGTIWTAGDIRANVLASQISSGDDLVNGFNTDDTIAGGAGNDTIDGLAGNDSYIWARGNGDDVVTEQTGNGTSDALTLTGINVADVSLVRDGLDITIIIEESAPGAGDGGSVKLIDQYQPSYSRGVEQIVFADGTIWSAQDLIDEVVAAEGGYANAIEGYTNVIHGDSSNNIITGGTDNDILVGYAGADTLDGGAGSDAASYLDSDAGVSVDLTAGTATGGHAQGDVLTSIESLIGSQHDDTFTGNGADNLMVYTGGVDTFDGQSGQDTVDFSQFISAVWIDLEYNGTEVWTRDDLDLATGAWREIVSLDSVENIIGTEFDDDVWGNASDNTFSHTGGNDSYDGRAGTDGIDFSQYEFAVWADIGSSSSAWTREGTDVASGTWSLISDFVSIENLEGSNFDDELYGSSGDNRIAGGAGDDLLSGGSGNDTFVFGDSFGQDVVSDFESSDVLEFSSSLFSDFAAVQSASQQVGNDVVITSTTNDQITLQNFTLAAFVEDDVFIV